QNRVGRTVRLGSRDYRVVGVLAPWRPPARIFDLTRNAFGPPEPIYIPFNLVEPLKLASTGNNSGWKHEDIKTVDDYFKSERIWLQYRVELPDQQSVTAYHDWRRA